MIFDDGYAAVHESKITSAQAEILNKLLDKCLPETKAKVFELHGDLSHLSKSEFNTVHQNISRAAMKWIGILYLLLRWRRECGSQWSE